LNIIIYESNISMTTVQIIKLKLGNWIKSPLIYINIYLQYIKKIMLIIYYVCIVIYVFFEYRFNYINMKYIIKK